MLTTAVLLTLLLAALALPWGPGHHIEFASRVYRRRKECLPRDVARLVHEERAAFFYGNIAADIINFKSYGGEYTDCHRWSLIAKLRDHGGQPRHEAFALGYLAHLAADTIAHNHFVPYHLARYARTRGLGHIYWEMSADRFVPETHWDIITELRDDNTLDDLDQLINETVPKKALSMSTNKLIFNHVLLISHRQRWRRGMARLHPLPKVQLTAGFLSTFQRAAVERVKLALHPKGFRQLAQRVDPNGKEVLARALKLRERLTHRLSPGGNRAEESEKLARSFLEGMESPPPPPEG